MYVFSAGCSFTEFDEQCAYIIAAAKSPKQYVLAIKLRYKPGLINVMEKVANIYKSQ